MFGISTTQIFNPAGIPDLFLHSHANRIDVGGVSSWPDISGNGRNYANASGATQPVCTANQQVTKNGIIFTNDFLVSTFGATLPADMTTIIVGKVNSNAGGNQHFSDSTDIVNRQVIRTNGSVFQAGTPTVANGAAIDLNPHIFLLRGGTTGDFYIDGVAQFTNTNLGSATAAGSTLGARYTTTDLFLNCTIFEVLIYLRKINTNEQKALENYCSRGWGIPIS